MLVIIYFGQEVIYGLYQEDNPTADIWVLKSQCWIYNLDLPIWNFTLSGFNTKLEQQTNLVLIIKITWQVFFY